jgi:hypothetical protein
MTSRFHPAALIAGTALCAAVAMTAVTITAAAQNKGAPVSDRWPTTNPSIQAPANPKASQPVTTQDSPIQLSQALYLIRSTLLTLNDANRSGNYSVLRDLAAPDFRARNTAADLAAIFADLRARKFDLFAVAIEAPQLAATPSIGADRMLRLRGHFPTRPLQIEFDLLFQDVGGQWLLFGISVATPPAPVANQQPSARPATR